MYKTYFAIQNSKGDLLKLDYDNRHETTYVEVYEMDVFGAGRALFEKKEHVEYELEELKNGYSYDIDEYLEDDIQNFKIVEVEVSFDIRVK